MDRRNEDDVGTGSSIAEKQSVDDDIRSMLSVTPVNVPPLEQSTHTEIGRSATESNDEPPSTDNDPESNEDQDTFSSSSASSGSVDNSEESEEESDDSGVMAEEDEDEDDDEEEDGEEEEGDQVPLLESTHHHHHHPQQHQQNQPTPTPTQSEWDRAVMTGKQSKGRASDFFVPSQPILSSDSSEFYSTLHTARATAPRLSSPAVHTSTTTTTTGGASQHVPPPRPHSRNQNTSHAVDTTSTTATTKTITSVQEVDNTSTSTNAGGHKPLESTASAKTTSNSHSLTTSSTNRPPDYYPATTAHTEEHLSAGVLPDVLMTMRQRIESINMFDSDLLRLTNDYVVNDDDDPMFQESRESLKRSSQQSISAAVLVSLAHKRYERRRLAAMEIEKVVRSLVVLQHQSKQVKNELDRVRAILLLLSDDYVRSTNEDARKGGVVALAACAIGLKKANDQNPIVQECRDLILASVVHACQDHSQRVRYYATESLFNVVKGMWLHIVFRITYINRN
jgi:hypothetical protein